MKAPQNILMCSAMNLWEITIKSGLGRAEFQVDPHLLRSGLVENGCENLPVTSQHAVAI